LEIKMSNVPNIYCSAWQDGEEIPVEYTAPKSPNLNLPGDQQPANKQPDFKFTNLPAGTRAIALVVHDILDGEPVDGVRPGWTHYTAIYSPEGELLSEGETDDEPGWTGPYPEVSGEYHCTAYFLSTKFEETGYSRSKIIEVFGDHGLGSANMVGKYTNPLSKQK
jgi:phosphatidylethanolamine-binding protein (PEBP) family uncharacterized protein